MSNLQEALAVLEQRKKTPLSGLLEGFATGFNRAHDQRFENAKRILEMDQMRQQIENQRALADEAAKEMKRASMQETSNALKNAGVQNANPFPAMRFKTKLSLGKEGWTKSIESTDEDAPKVSFQAKEYDAGGGEIRIGRWNPQTGTLEKSPSDPVAAKSVPSLQFIGTQNGVPVLLNPKTGGTSTAQLPGQGSLMPTTQTEGQANAGLFADKMEEANNVINGLVDEGYDLASLEAAIQGKGPNWIKNEVIQKFEQAKRNFINASLRRESGAVISPSEFKEGNKQYFPVYGDKEGTLKQKATNRITQINGIRNAAGRTPLKTRTTMKIGRFEVELEE